jgi:hypothetical protein
VTDLSGTSGGAHLGGTTSHGSVHQQHVRGDQPEGKSKEVVDVAQQANQEGVQQEEVVFKAQTQGSIEVDAQKGEDSIKDKEDTSDFKQPKVHEPPFCHRCKIAGHISRECRRG